DGLRVEDALIEADGLAGILERAVALVPQVAVGRADTAEHDVEVAVVVHIPDGGAGKVTGELRQADLLTHVRELALAVVLEQPAGACLRDEHVEGAPAEEIGHHRTDTAGLVAEAAVLDDLEALGRVADEQAVAGAVEEILAAVAVEVEDGQRVALDAAADAGRAQADLVGDVLERPGNGRRHVGAGLEVVGPVAVALADLDEQLVLALAQLEGGLVLVRGTGTVGRVADDLDAVEPDCQRVVTAEGTGQITQ